MWVWGSVTGHTLKERGRNESVKHPSTQRHAVALGVRVKRGQLAAPSSWIESEWR